MREWMRRVVLFGCLGTALALPLVGNAQAPGGFPPVAGDDAGWQFSNEPMLFNGLVYYPTRGTRLFDGQIMTQIGTYRSVPVFADVTLQPFTVVYVPVGRGVLRTYQVNAVRDLASAAPPQIPEPAVATSGAAVPAAVSMSSTTADVPRPTRMESIRRPEPRDGIWLEYEGVRYYNDGAAVPFDPARFTRIGEYRGFPVYRASAGRADAIWVPIFIDGPVAPYAKRS